MWMQHDKKKFNMFLRCCMHQNCVYEKINVNAEVDEYVYTQTSASCDLYRQNHPIRIDGSGKRL
jgi:hypothetical protein